MGTNPSERPSTGPGPEASTGSDLLERIRTERGYTLSYHEIYSRLEPRFLEAYAGLYRACTLDQRFLTAPWRETVWIALLNGIREEVGSIHLERAVAAGVTQGDVVSAIRLAGVSEAWESLAFAFSHWGRFVPGDDAQQVYLELVNGARGSLDERLVDLVLMVVHAARQRPEAFLLHLDRCYAGGLPEEQIGEALSYVLQPVGANRLLWATDLWLAALRDGRLAPSPSFGRADFTTRLS